MQQEPIILDTTPRGWWSRVSLPIALVQTFRPCHWSDFTGYLGESECFRELFRDRVLWLKESGLPHNIHYDSCELEVEENSPRAYRIFTEFASTADSIVYKMTWCNGTVPRI